jgi:uncharacterized membrane protein YuzA (DUF378 family)
LFSNAAFCGGILLIAIMFIIIGIGGMIMLFYGEKIREKITTFFKAWFEE